MSRSELNNSGNIGIQKSGVAAPQPVIQSMHLAFGPEGNPVYKPISCNVNGDPAKKKRGRPRKYGPEGPIQVPLSPPPPAAHVTISSGTFASQPPPPPAPSPQLQMVLHSQPQESQQQNHQAHPPHQQHHQQAQPPHQQNHQAQPPHQQHLQAQTPHQQQHQAQPPHHQLPQQPQSASAAVGSSSPSMKKARGRPPGSGKKHQLESLGAPGIGFTPHVITVNTGEDVASRIMSFTQTGPRAICILSANGAISNVTLRQAATSGGSVTYEGRFEILSLSGSFMLSDSGGQRSRSGGLSVSLAGPDGRVLGGGIAGLLTAASPVQVVVGSFIAESQRETKVGNPTETVFAASKPYVASVGTGPSSPTSRGTLSGSSGGGGSPLNQSTGAVNSTPLGISSLPWK